MKPQTVTVGSATVSAWVPLNPRQNPISVSLAVTLSSGAALTYKVQHTLDNPNDFIDCLATRSTTTATIKYADHGLTTSDYVVIQGVAPFDSGAAGYAVASVVDADTITVTVANSGSAGSVVRVARARVFDHDTITGKIAQFSGNYVLPVQACRLNVTAYTSGKATLTVLQAVE